MVNPVEFDRSNRFNSIKRNLANEQRALWLWNDNGIMN